MYSKPLYIMNVCCIKMSECVVISNEIKLFWLTIFTIILFVDFDRSVCWLNCDLLKQFNKTNNDKVDGNVVLFLIFIRHVFDAFKS